MKKITKIIGVASSCAVLLTSSAFSDNLIGAKLSYGHFKADGNNQVIGGSNTTGSHTANFPYASIFAEHGFSNGFRLGVDYVPFSAEIETKSQSDSDLQAGGTTVTGTKKAKAELKHHTTLYLNTPKKNNFYGKIGYSMAQVKISDFQNTTNSSTLSDKKESMDGPMIGVGYEKELSNGVVLRAEATYTNYSDIKFTGSTGSTVKADTENFAAHLSVAKKF